MHQPRAEGIAMTTRWAEIEAGARRDLVVFVDDWKGTPPVLDTTPVAYVGRAYRHDEAFESLANTLERAEAHRWHVSQRGSGSLFISPQFGEVLQILEESRSVLFSQVWTMGQYSQADVKGFVSSLQPEFRSAWRVHNPHGLALLEFALRLRWYLGNTELAKRDALSVLLVADNADWLGKAPANGVNVLSLPPSTHALSRRVMVETIVVREKRINRHLPFLRFLGLADSEAWAFGRHLSARLVAGDSFHERMVAWQRTGIDHGLTPDDVQLGLGSGGGRSREYLEHAIAWPITGQGISLTTIHDRYYLARSLARAMVNLERMKRALTESECETLYQNSLRELSVTVFAPRTEGTWLD
jgi:hypothetical protein